MTEFFTYVAEKPKLGRAIAECLSQLSPKVDSGRDFVAGKDWAVCWAAGHIYGQEEPDYYIAQKFTGAQKTTKGKFVWSFDHLPIFPGLDGWPAWALSLDPDKASLCKTIKRWISRADVVVNAGDPDREGQLLIDEILQELGNKKPVRRVLISAFDKTTVEAGLKNIQDNKIYLGLSQAGKARGFADWLCGMNFSRAATLHAQKNGYRGKVTIGRVQTPLLGLIVQRDLEIENFKPVDYFSLTAQMAAVVGGGLFSARWRPHDGQLGLDDEGRLLDRGIADQLNALVRGKTGLVVEYSDEEKQEGAPLPFSIDKLQILASKKYGYTSDVVLAAVQSLYLTHDLVTYPRSDKCHLPVSQHAAASTIIAAVTHSLSFDKAVIDGLDPSRKSRAWNDKKSTPHHGIIPTEKRGNLSALSPIERTLYEEICKRYLAQFMPPRRYRSVSAVIDVCGQNFAATGSTTLSPGWRVLYGAATEEPDEPSSSDEGIVLPPMKKGDSILCNGLQIEPKKTVPPKHFTDGTLLEAMVNIHKFVTDERVKQIFMKMLANNKGSGDEESEGACGLGTPATRHTFVPKLADVGFLERKSGKGKSKETMIISTAAGRAFIAAIPAELGKPDMTALWETGMGEIEAGTATLDAFISMQTHWIRQTIDKICATPLVLPEPPGGSNGSSGSAPRSGPRKPAEPAGKNCPKCGKPMVKRKGAKGPFFGCSGYPQCKHLENIQ